MIYLATNADGLNTEGIGAMVQYQLFCYSLSRHLGFEYLFSGFKNLNHWQYNGTSQAEFIDDVNCFFNLPTTSFPPDKDVDQLEMISINNKIYDLFNYKRDLVVNVHPAALMQYGQMNISEIERNGWIKSLSSRIGKKSKISLNKKSEQDFHISIHIRKYTKTDCDPSPIRDLYDDSKNEYYTNLVGSLCDFYSDKNPKVNIYSQGRKDDFEFLMNFKNVNLCIEEHPLSSLYSMINSEIFVMANSSLSYVASLYRDRTTYKKINFYHSTYDSNVYEISTSGKIR